jgi:hypothetical protein
MAPTPKSIAFRTTIELHGKTATGIEVPAPVVEQLGTSRRPPVQVTIGSHTFRTTIMPMGGRYLLPLNAANRESAGVAAGATITVKLALDTAERTVTVPPALASAMKQAAGLRATFDGLSYTARKEIALAITSAKQEETRVRRIEKAIAELKAVMAKKAKR